MIEGVLKEIGAGDVPTILVPNKTDVIASVPLQKLKDRAVEGVCPISALTGAGVDRLLQLVGTILDHGKEQFRACFKPSQVGLLSLLRERGRIIEEIYEDSQIFVTALVTPKLAGQIRKLLTSGVTSV